MGDGDWMVMISLLKRKWEKFDWKRAGYGRRVARALSGRG
jgi:hypothetical protein